jgi:hypothetical protein
MQISCTHQTRLLLSAFAGRGGCRPSSKRHLGKGVSISIWFAKGSSGVLHDLEDGADTLRKQNFERILSKISDGQFSQRNNAGDAPRGASSAQTHAADPKKCPGESNCRETQESSAVQKFPDLMRCSWTTRGHHSVEKCTFNTETKRLQEKFLLFSLSKNNY